MILWVLIILAIILNGVDTLNPNNNLTHSIFHSFDQIPYGNYIAKKWFLVIVAIFTFVFWLAKKQDLLKKIKPHLIPIIVIGLSLLLARYMSLQGWFWHDDYRMIGYFYQNTNLVDANYPLGIFFLLIRWFGINYTLYDGLTLIFYFLSGILVFLISNQIQKHKYVSLLATVFFVTSASYFQEWLLIINFAGNAFVLLLFLISLYLCLKKFWAGALIFTAATLEFGFVRTNLVPFYIILAGLLFNSKKILMQKKTLLVLGAFLILLLPYIALSLANLSFSPGVVVPSKINDLLTIGDMLAEIAVPFAILVPLMKFIGPIFNNWSYLPVALGYLIFLLLLILIFIYRKKLETLKTFILGFFIFTSGTVVPALLGRRVHHDAEKFLVYLQSAPYPTVQTAYSIFSVVGLTIFSIGLGSVVKPKFFKIGMTILIALNIFTYIKSDNTWIQNYAYPQRKENSQLETLLPKTQPLYIYVPLAPNPSLKFAQRHLWQGIKNFQMTHRPTQTINAYLYQKDFEASVSKDSLSSNQIYLLQEDLSYIISKLPQSSRR